MRRMSAGTCGSATLKENDVARKPVSFASLERFWPSLMVRASKEAYCDAFEGFLSAFALRDEAMMELMRPQDRRITIVSIQCGNDAVSTAAAMSTY